MTTGQTATRTLTIRNSGSGTLSGNVSTGCGEFTVEGVTAYSLSAGQSRAFTIRFSPTVSSAAACDLATGTPCGAVHLSGNGSAPPFQLILHDVDLGRRGPQDRGGFAILNTGTSTLTGTVTSTCPNFVLVDENALDQTSVSYSIPPNDVFNAFVSFRPTTGGPQSCVIQTGLPGAPGVTFTGFGQECETTPPFLDLGTAWESIDRTFQISNPDSFTMSGTLTTCQRFDVSPLSYSLAPGQSQTITAKFSHSGFLAGSASCTPDLGQSTCPPVSLSLQDEVLPAALGGCAGTTVAILDFGTLNPGQVASKTLTVKCFVERMGGGNPPCAGSLVEQAGSLSFTNGAFSGLAVGDSSHVTATFSSMEPGVHHCRVMVTTNDNNSGRIAGYMECRATVLPAVPARSFRAAGYR